MPFKVSSSYFARTSSSVPNSGGIANFGIMGSESSLKLSTRSATSRVAVISSGFSAKSCRISSSVLKYSCPV